MNSIQPTQLARVEPEVAQSTRRLPNFVLTNEFGLLILIIAFAILFSLQNENFLSRFNLFALSRNLAIYALVGMAMMAVIVTGGLNLAIGAIGVCAARLFGWTNQVVGLHWSVSVVLGLSLATALGAVNGWLVVKTGIHSFVITLATMSIFFGLMVFMTQAQSFRGLSPEVINFGKSKILNSFSPLLLMAIVAGVMLSTMYKFTALGREMLAAGATPEAAELSGVSVGRTFMYCHMLSAFLAGFTALLLTSRYGAAIPSMAGQLGQDWLLPAFLGPVLGGTILTGGRVSVLGTFLGATLVVTLTNGLLMLQVGEFWVQTVLGVLLLLAVLGDKARRHYLMQRGLA